MVAKAGGGRLERTGTAASDGCGGRADAEGRRAMKETVGMGEGGRGKGGAVEAHDMPE